MSELEALLVIHGAIDSAVVENRSDHLSTVARYYGPYDEGGRAVGWFEHFAEWTSEMTGVSTTDIYQTDRTAVLDAIAELAEITPTDYSLARRMLVLAVASRVLVAEALVTQVELGDALGFGNAEQERARDLLDLLSSNEHFGDVGQWSSMLELALKAGFVSAEFVTHNPRPHCSAKLITLAMPGSNPGAMVEVAALKTDYVIPDLTFDEARKVLEPEYWPRCNPLWCKLEDTGRLSDAGNRIFDEIVSLNCFVPIPLWTAECELEFTRFDDTGISIISYNLANPNAKPGDAIQVDSGSLAIRDLGADGIHVVTTKRIRFRYAFVSHELAMIACVFGYGCVAEALVYCCATLNSRKRKPDGDPMQRAIEATKKCIDECATAYQGSYKKAVAGEYKADDLVKDMAWMWTRMMRDAAAGVGFGVDIANEMADQAAKSTGTSSSSSSSSSTTSGPKAAP